MAVFSVRLFNYFTAGSYPYKYILFFIIIISQKKIIARQMFSIQISPIWNRHSALSNKFCFACKSLVQVIYGAFLHNESDLGIMGFNQASVFTLLQIFGSPTDDVLQAIRNSPV